MSRIGVFVFQCGTIIGGVVNTQEVAEYASTLPNVVHVENNKYTCSDPNQKQIKEAIEQNNLDRIVVAACSPSMHELTWQKLLSQTSVNPYMLEVANIRALGFIPTKKKLPQKPKTFLKWLLQKSKKTLHFIPSRFPSPNEHSL